MIYFSKTHSESKMKEQNIEFNIPKLAIFAKGAIDESKIGRVSELHYHDELEFLNIQSGKLSCRVDGVDYFAEAGEIIFVNGGIPHETFSYDDSTRYTLVQFRESQFVNTEIRKIIKYSVKFQSWEGAPVRILHSQELSDVLEKIVEECETKARAYEILVRSHILRIIGLLYRDNILYDGEEAFATDAVQKILPALTHINSNYQEDIRLEDMSSLLGFDRSYFCRIFKLATGATFTEYLNFVRICKAEKLLATTNETVLDISADVGFSSVSYFNRIFKKYKNSSPSKYRSAKYCKDI